MESTGTESAAPTSTADIAASVIESAEAADTSSSTGESSSPARIDTTNAVEEKTAPAAQAPPTQAELSAAAKFLLKEGHQAKKVDGRDVWLPHGTVEKMLDRYLDQHKTTWQTERQSFESRVQESQTQLEQLRAAVAGDPRAFLRELADIDPRYAAFLQQQVERAPAPAADDPEPPPDFDLGNGQRTYSVEGLAKREAWVRRQLERELLGKLDERLKPWQEREQQAKQREAQEKAIGEIRDRATSQMQDAQTWPLFGKLADDGSLTEFQQSVLDELKRDTEAAKAAGQTPKLTLEGAYIRVASKRFTEDDTTKRERLLKEIQGAPKSTALSRQTTDAPRQSGPRSTQEIARQVIGKLENAG